MVDTLDHSAGSMSNFERYVGQQLNSRVDPLERTPEDQDPDDRRHVAATPAEAVIISRSLGAKTIGVKGANG